MPLSPGTTLGPYVIRSLLGSGGMGEVYRARDTKLDRDVALKLLPAGLANDAERLRRFELEARSASALNHPAIVAIYELGQAGAQSYISMELVEGQTLREMLKAGSMPARRALQVAAPIADGLAKAHEAGIVHRDLKPENLMVSHDGFAKILDFGLAKLVGSGEAREALPTMTARGTQPGSVMGTVDYMSPEQASGGAVDNRSDQFSFGLVLYEMLTGRRAFSQPTAVETLSAIIREDPTPIGQLSPSVPAPVRWIVERCLAKAPADRYGSTRDLARDLAGARDHFSELTSSGATTVSAAVPAARVRRRELVAWGLAAMLALAVVSLIVRRSGPPPAQADPPVRFTVAPPEKVIFESSFGTSPFAVSPDGHHLAFTGVRMDGTRGLWLHSFDSLVSRSLPGTEGASAPFWSPDGLAIGFFTENHLKRASIAGGDVATICEVRSGGAGTWNRDGVIVFAPAIDSGLFRVAATGGTPAPVTTLDPAREESGHLLPMFLPDGRHFVFGIIGGPGGAGTYVASLDSQQRERVSPEQSMYGFRSPDFLFFTQSRTLMAQRLDLDRFKLTGEPIRVAEGIERVGPGSAFAVSASGTLVYWAGARSITQPTWFQRDGTRATPLGSPGGYMNVALSHDGQQAALDRFDLTPGIWLLDATRGTAIRATSAKLYESTPVWSPDASAFVFAAARDTPPNLYLKQIGLAGNGERLFGSAAQTLFPQSWSRDGNFIAYVSMDPQTGADIWVLERSGDRKPVPFLQSQFWETHARISPDGRWLAYASNESVTQGVHVTSFPKPGRKWPVSPNGGGFPVWGRLSRELFYRASDGMLMAVPVGPGADFAPGAPIPLFKPRAAVGDLGFGTFYDVAPDGRFLINILVERTAPPANVVLNWRAGTAPSSGR